MTPRTLIDPFIEYLGERVQAIEEMIATIETTPENQGELRSIRYIRFELNRRLHLQDKGEIDEEWEEAFIASIRRGNRHPQTRRDYACNQYDQLYANELEIIWRAAGIL